MSWTVFLGMIQETAFLSSQLQSISSATDILSST